MFLPCLAKRTAQFAIGGVLEPLPLVEDGGWAVAVSTACATGAGLFNGGAALLAAAGLAAAFKSAIGSSVRRDLPSKKAPCSMAND